MLVSEDLSEREVEAEERAGKHPKVSSLLVFDSQGPPRARRGHGAPSSHLAIAKP